MCPSFAIAILLLVGQVDFSVTSWIRTEKRNHMVGGVETSKHLTGQAVDIVLDDWADLDKLLKLLDKTCLFIGIQQYHLHIEALDGPYYLHIEALNGP